MSDEKRRRMERETKAAGVITAPSAVSKLAADARRLGKGRARQYLDNFKNTWLYVEGNKMNYVVYCLDVVYDDYEVPQGIMCSPAYRVGDWGASGVSTAHMQRLPADPPRFMQFFGIAELGPAPDSWVKTCEDAPDDQNVPAWRPPDGERPKDGNGYLDLYKDTWLYVEGNKMNYVVYCCDVVYDVQGVPMGIACSRAYRVGDWGADGVNTDHMQRLPADPPRFMQFFGIAELGPAPALWVEACEREPENAGSRGGQVSRSPSGAESAGGQAAGGKKRRRRTAAR